MVCGSCTFIRRFTGSSKIYCLKFCAEFCRTLDPWSSYKHMHVFCKTARNRFRSFVIFFVAFGSITFVSFKQYLDFIFISCTTLIFLRQVNLHFEVLVALITKVSVLQDVTPCILVELYRHFRGNRRLLGWRIRKTTPRKTAPKQSTSLSLSNYLQFAYHYFEFLRGKEF